MANAENGLVSPESTGGQPGAPGRTRAGKPAGPAFKPMHHEDMDPAEFASMLEAYDDSFRNMAEGEVVKGTVLKVTEAAVVVDVGYKSEGLIPIHEFLDENGNVTVQLAIRSTCCSSVPKIVKATSCCRARRPRR